MIPDKRWNNMKSNSLPTDRLTYGRRTTCNHKAQYLHPKSVKVPPKKIKKRLGMDIAGNV